MSGDGPDGQRPRRRNPAGRSCSAVIAVVVAALLMLAVGCSALNPRLDVPVVSPLVCSVEGNWWYGGGLLGPPGCYQAP